jgi:hypothetical protein
MSFPLTASYRRIKEDWIVVRAKPAPVKGHSRKAKKSPAVPGHKATTFFADPHRPFFSLPIIPERDG